ncbi:hypothetical protein JHW43_006565 [Diplocarpon mali]|nr:hypothetical protein JHW43_006565 [Diplocarpon mali]
MQAFGSNIVELLPRGSPARPTPGDGRISETRGWLVTRTLVWISQAWSRHDVRIEDGADARNPSLEGRLPDQPAAIEAVRPPGTSHPHVIGVGDVSPAPVSGRLMRRLAPVNLLEVQSSSRGEARLQPGLPTASENNIGQPGRFRSALRPSMGCGLRLEPKGIRSGRAADGGFDCAELAARDLGGWAGMEHSRGPVGLVRPTATLGSGEIDWLLRSLRCSGVSTNHVTPEGPRRKGGTARLVGPGMSRSNSSLNEADADAPTHLPILPRSNHLVILSCYPQRPAQTSIYQASAVASRTQAARSRAREPPSADVESGLPSDQILHPAFRNPSLSPCAVRKAPSPSPPENDSHPGAAPVRALVAGEAFRREAMRCWAWCSCPGRAHNSLGTVRGISYSSRCRQLDSLDLASRPVPSRPAVGSGSRPNSSSCSAAQSMCTDVEKPAGESFSRRADIPWWSFRGPADVPAAEAVTA